MLKKILVILLALLLVCGVTFAESVPEEDPDAVTSATLKIDRLPPVESEGSTILVVYFSPDDTTRAAAYVVAAALNAEIFEIEAAEPYTADDLNYYNSKARCMTEMADESIRPEIAVLPEDLSGYDTVILGYPIWGGQAPKIVRTFLESVDLSGKTIIPFCTSNSSGIGNSDKTLYPFAGEDVTWEAGTRIKKGSTAQEIAEWAVTLAVPEK